MEQYPQRNYWNPANRFYTGSTPFGYYDQDPLFALDADRFCVYSARKLGWPQMEVELDAESFYGALEEAFTTYNAELYNFKVREQYNTYEGVDRTTIDTTIGAPRQTLNSIIRLAHNYGAEVGAGGNVEYYTGSLALTEGQQRYDLNAWAIENNIVEPGDAIEIKRIIHNRIPAIMRNYDPSGLAGMGSTLYMEAFGINGVAPVGSTVLWPINLQVLRSQAIEFNDEILRTHYGFELVNNTITVFPIPLKGDNLFFQYIKESQRKDPFKDIPSGTVPGTLVTNHAEIPYQSLVYANISQVWRDWVFKYGHAVVLEMLANVRGKYPSGIPYPKGSLQLNQDSLLSQADRMKDYLLEQLRSTLEKVTRESQLMRQQQEADFVRQTLSNVPLPIFIG